MPLMIKDSNPMSVIGSSLLLVITSFNLAFFLLFEDGSHFVLKDDSTTPILPISDCLAAYLSLLGPLLGITFNNLIISFVKVDHDLIANILSGSPLLANLGLVDCYGYSRLDINSKSVKSLVVSGYRGEHFVLEINAPYISSLTIVGDLWLFFFSLRDVSSVVEAKLGYHMIGYHGNPHLRKEEEEILNTLILNLRKVKELEIGRRCYEVLARLEVRGFTFPSNLKGVDFTSHLYSLAHSKALVDCRDVNDSSDSYGSDINDSSDDSDSVERGDSEEPVLCMFV